MKKTFLWGRWSPPRIVVSAFLSAIAVGTVLLRMPWASTGQQPLSWLQALFTATSATCVTGLIVVDTGVDLSPAGQAIVFALFQLGGLGIMTFSAFAGVLLGRTLRPGHRHLMVTQLGTEAVVDLGVLLRRIVVMMLSFEAVGAVVLALRWPGASAGESIWAGVFHSVSAFCNAGFALRADSLTPLRADPVVMLTVCGLVIAGGLGFPVLLEVFSRLSPRRPDRPFSLHSRLVLLVSAVLLAGGFVAFLVLEWNNSLAGLGRGEALLAALFQAVTPRTAGFNTLDIGALTPAALFLIMLLMFIGGSPASTAGGIKTTSLAILAAVVWSRARGRESISIFRRTAAAPDVRQVVTIVLSGAVLLNASVFLLLFLEQLSGGTLAREAVISGGHSLRPEFLQIWFEAVSALGTVGLSSGITSLLSAPSQVVIIVLMFLGRVGPLTAAMAMMQRGTGARYRYPEERILVG